MSSRVVQCSTLFFFFKKKVESGVGSHYLSNVYGPHRLPGSVPSPQNARAETGQLHTHLDSQPHRSHPHTLASRHIARGGVCTGWHHCDMQTAQGCTEALWTKGQEAVEEVAPKQKHSTELYPRQGGPGTSSPDAEWLPLVCFLRGL